MITTNVLASVRAPLGFVRGREPAPSREEGRVRSPEQSSVGHEQNRVHKASGGGVHITVLANGAVDLLALKDGDFVLDATAGEGGHSELLLNTAAITLLALDADPHAVAHTRARLAPFGERAQVVEANFGDVDAVLKARGQATVDKALFDLGWNRGQLASGRGFSFLKDEPLVMSYGPTPASGFTAAEILNTWEEHVIADVLFGYGEERYARRIANAIVEARGQKNFTTTKQLVDIIAGSVPAVYRRGKINCATRSFQALRIAVNDELGVLERGLRSTWAHMSSGGRIAVITFHSIEDRLVKRLFVEFEKEQGLRLTKKPIVPSAEELSVNVSARSAKLRVIEKI